MVTGDNSGGGEEGRELEWTTYCVLCMCLQIYASVRLALRSQLYPALQTAIWENQEIFLKSIVPLHSFPSTPLYLPLHHGPVTGERTMVPPARGFDIGHLQSSFATRGVSKDDDYGPRKDRLAVRDEPPTSAKQS